MTANTLPPFALTDRARDVWEAVWHKLDAHRWFYPALDGFTLATYCQLQADLDALGARIDRAGLVDPEGRPHPLADARRQLATVVLAYAADLGLTPLSRAKITAATTSAMPPREPWEDDQ